MLDNEIETLSRFRTWLGALQNPDSEYKKNRKHLVEGTCTWILGTEGYREFIDSQEQKHLWVHGKPGKTTERPNHEFSPGMV
jgi:hypothetical protein